MMLRIGALLPRIVGALFHLSGESAAAKFIESDNDYAA